MRHSRALTFRLLGNNDALVEASGSVLPWAASYLPTVKPLFVICVFSLMNTTLCSLKNTTQLEWERLPSPLTAQRSQSLILN